MDITVILPLISALFVIFLGIFVFLKNKRSKLNIIFLLFSVVNFIWFFGTFMMFSGKSVHFWDRFVYVGVIFIPSLVFHFGLVFAQRDRKYRPLVILGYILSFVFLFFNLFSKIFISDEVFAYQWGVHLKAGPVHHAFLVFFVVYLFMLYKSLIHHYAVSIDKLEKSKTIYVLLSLVFLTIGSIGFLPAYEISVYPFAYLSGLLFSVTVGYVIMRYNFLEIRDFASQLLILFINLVTFTQIFTSGSVKEYVGRSLFFALILVFSYLLVRSFQDEIERKRELERLASKLRRANARLKKLDQAKTEFLSIASHQLRTPLTAIKGYISLVNEGLYGEVSKDLKEVLGKIHISNERLINLVEDLLNISRIEAGRMQYKMADVQICNEIMKDLKDSFELRAKNKGLKLTFNRPKIPVPKIRMDKNKIREVISNIIDNAIKYTEKGSVEVKVRNVDGIVRVSVTDTGIGIPKSEMPYLFKKFSRGKDVKRLNADGTGLGIYLAKKIISDHNGRIYIRSKGHKKGSTFVIELPVVKSDEDEKENVI